MSSILRPKQLAKYLSISLATLWRLNKRGELPQKIQISQKAVGWSTADIDDWLKHRMIAK